VEYGVWGVWCARYGTLGVRCGVGGVAYGVWSMGCIEGMGYKEKGVRCREEGVGCGVEDVGCGVEGANMQCSPSRSNTECAHIWLHLLTYGLV